MIKYLQKIQKFQYKFFNMRHENSHIKNKNIAENYYRKKKNNKYPYKCVCKYYM